MLTAIVLFRLWLDCRKYETDRWGYCHIGLFKMKERINVLETYVPTEMETYVPTAMVPLWIPMIRENDKIQKNVIDGS